MKIIRFEDLESWQKARIATRMVYELARKPAFSKDYRLTGQITGAAISIMNNIAEGFDSQSNNVFVRYLKISRGSVSEVENCLYVAVDQNYITQDEFRKVFDQSERVRKLIDGTLRYLRSNRAQRNQRD
ncbi:MAG: four helix bundle protein [Planctomycetes bacterium]|nr:four helix bundle protein [Planctomycetota bacterium]